MRAVSILFGLIFLAAAAHGQTSVALAGARICEAGPSDTLPPDFGREGCVTTNLHEIDPQGRLIWVQMRLDITAVPEDRPLGMFVGGAMATTIFINGRLIGSNGRPGLNRSSEQPGQMDAVLFVPPDTLRPGENEIAALMSSHHGPVEFAYPVHYLMMAEFASPRERILRAYWPALINLGVFVIAFFVFGFSALRGEDKEGALILTLAALVISAQLILETSRGLFGYAYPLHAWRMFGVVTMAAGFGALALAHILKRFSGWSARLRWGVVALSSTVVLVVTAFTASYDPKTLLALIIPLLIALPLLAWWSRKGGALVRIHLLVFSLLGLALFVSLDRFIDVSIFYFASALLFLQFFDSAVSLARARRLAATESHRAERLEMALEQARLRAEPVQIQLHSAGKLERLNISEIVHLQAAGDYVEIHFSNGGARLFSTSLNDIESQLPETFLRVHRSHIVNTAFVVSLTREASGVGLLALSTSDTIPVSRRIMPKVRSALSRQGY
ncbi:LytTR family DNA-binding domain-containing protein [Hyphobacterium sp. HN65]|uniref:LytTR family DNA-binding domain-containing protein n=1 Tax=Hyphobacterium lacteum TaxID=3116575 RepID=A0ABU7LLI1_9PROT|nr:LytTR family DNA-binding domain-containing protein [Hyphobacterium sp. HN65]MEE2524743.1 LytTR family DNA-binding domain-containing protein [Hyphobacterium sp. HN65]